MTTPKTPIPGIPSEDYTSSVGQLAAGNGQAAERTGEPTTYDPPRIPDEHRPPPAVRSPSSDTRAPAVSRVPRPAHVGLAFLLLTVAGFVALGAALPRYTLSSTARRALTYDTLFADLHDALIDEPDRPLRRAIRAVQVDALVPTTAGYAIITFDTLAISPESTYPSLLPGGFLHDEVDRFNAYQRERLDAIRRGRLSGGSVRDLRAEENPSMFRTEIRATDDGRGDRDTVVLAERAVPYALRVPSPFDAARLVAVTTREWSRSLGWISARGAQPVAESGRIPGEPPCPFRTAKDSVYIECTAPGSPFRQLVLRFPDKLGETGTATLFTSERTLYDGAQLPRRRSVPIGTGGMFQFHSAALASGRSRPEPVILEWTLAGTLGGTQWINGRIRWQPSVSHTSPFVKQLASAAGFGASAELEGGRNIPLSLDESFTDELQLALEEFAGCAPAARAHGCVVPNASGNRSRGSVRRETPRVVGRHGADIAFATIVIASAKTGEILGVAEYGPPATSGGSWILRPVNVGSAIKPVLAAAVLMRRPELATLEIRNDGPTMYDIWGVPLDKGFEAGSACPFGWIGLREFLSCSSNRYSAALVAAALQPAANLVTVWDEVPGSTYRLRGQTHTGRPHLPLDPRRLIRPDTMNASALSAGLFDLDSLNTSLELASQLGREGRDSSVWEHLRDDRQTPVRVPLGLWPEQSRLALTRGNRYAGLRQLAMFAVGASENRMTTLDLTQAFARLLTDRRLALTFVPRLPYVSANQIQASFQPLGLSKTSWYSTLIGGLRDVGLTGTAKGTQDAVTHRLSASLFFYGKSGTLNAQPHVRILRRVDSTMVNGELVVRPLAFVDTVVPPVVAKVLLFGLGVREGRARTPADSATAGAAIKCGVVGTIYFRLHNNPQHVESLATEFANERLWLVLRKHWPRLKVC
jgi:hypothetical protein